MMTNFIIPLAPQLKERGIGVDMEAFMKIMAQYSNLPELEQILEKIPQEELQQMAEMAGGASSGERPLQSPVTSRTNIRENISGATRQGNDQESMRNLMAMANQGQQQ
jgi:hypothetical protein